MQTTRQLLHEGVLDVLWQFTGLSEGNGDNEINVVKADVSELTDAATIASLKIVRVEYEVSGGVVRVLWDADDPKTFLDLASVGVFDYEDIRGATNPSTVPVSGDILFSTIGFDTGSSYSVKLFLRKKYKV